jgi:hypothetical protein
MALIDFIVINRCITGVAISLFLELQPVKQAQQ